MGAKEVVQLVRSLPCTQLTEVQLPAPHSVPRALLGAQSDVAPKPHKINSFYVNKFCLYNGHSVVEWNTTINSLKTLKIFSICAEFMPFCCLCLHLIGTQ